MNRLDESPVIQVKNVSKDFSGVFALKDVSMSIYPGQVNALIGENGAGKSTLMKILAGIYNDYSGEIIFKGSKISFNHPRDADKAGISIIHQELNLVSHMSVAENIFLGREPKNYFGFVDYGHMNKTTRQLLGKLNLDIAPDTPVYKLRVGQQQLVEIARVLSFDCQVLIMDEPTSAISDKETDLLFDIISGLRNKGVAIVYISHKIDELFRIADRFVALRDGQYAGEMEMASATPEDMIRMMVGRDNVSIQTQQVTDNKEEIIRVKGFGMKKYAFPKRYVFQNVEFSLHRGEILGVSGLMGAGRTELLEALFGLHPGLVEGEVTMEGKRVEFKNVQDAIKHGLSLVPEDRKQQGLIFGMNVMKNTSLANLKSLMKGFLLDGNKEKKLVKKYSEDLRIKVSSVQQPIDTLSGGNQQKVVIAKWLATNPKILMLDEPTRGIDVGAKQEIYKLINKLASEGMAIIMVSSELPEILALSHRILVLSESKMTALLHREEASEEIIMKAALAGKRN